MTPEDLSLPPKMLELEKQVDLLSNPNWLVSLLIGKNAKKDFKLLKSQIDEMKSTIMEFNQSFQKLGWLMSESVHMEKAKEAVALFRADKVFEAEELLASQFETKALDALVLTFHGIKPLRNRMDILQEAVKLCHEGRYLAAVPLIFIAADGFGQDYFGKAIFSEGLDLTEINAIAGQSTGLEALTAEMGRRRQAFNTEPLNFPYRNGIMHGRDVNYGNRLVAAKAWAHLSCVADLIRARENAEYEQSKAKPELSFSETLKGYHETFAESKRVKDWKPREIFKPTWRLLFEQLEFESGSPEAILVEFIIAWNKQNFGKMGELTVYFDNRPINKRAGQIKDDLKEVKLLDAIIIKIKDDAAAVTMIECELTVSIKDQTYTDKIDFRMIFGDASSNALRRGNKEGSWKVIPSYLGWALGLMHK